MRRCRRLSLTCLFVVGIAVGCGSGGFETSDGSADEPRDPPLLQAGHTGYKHPHCVDCHETPVKGHSVTRAPSCAVCHGGNGACDPNGLYSLREHLASEACSTCHEAQHGYSTDADCAACHLADDGIDDTCAAPPPDPAGGLRAASELSSGCHGWPDQPFTPENNAEVELGLVAGASAVDFTLQTPAGIPVTLADLLLTRPVVLVTGAFT